MQEGGGASRVLAKLALNLAALVLMQVGKSLKEASNG